MNPSELEPRDHTASGPTLRSMADEALHDLIHFDTKLFRSLPLLLFRPGRLTQKYLTDVSF
jgi:Protein of unknown function (DUF3667)